MRLGAGGLQTSFLFFLAKSKTEAAEFCPPSSPPLMPRIGGGGAGRLPKAPLGTLQPCAPYPGLPRPDSAQLPTQLPA